MRYLKIFGTVFFVGVVLGGYAFTHAGLWLVHADIKPSEPTLGILLMGNLDERAPEAARLLKEGKISKVLFFPTEPKLAETLGLVPTESELTRIFLTKEGISPEQVEIDRSVPPVMSTNDEAHASAHWLQASKLHPSKIVVITSWYHTSRARWIFSKVLRETLGEQSPAIVMAAAVRPKSHPEAWWKEESDFLAVINEYIKWVYYLANYS